MYLSGVMCDAQTTINGIMAHVQTFFNLQSTLGTKILINIKRIDHVSGTYTASTANINTLGGCPNNRSTSISLIWTLIHPKGCIYL